MSSPLPLVLASDDGPYSQVRTGIVATQDASFVSVLVGGSPVRAAYARGATFTQGDVVAVIRQDASWLVLFAYAGQGPNEIQNPSFELSPPGLFPSLWFLADIVNVSNASVVSSPDVPDGAQYAEITSDAATSQSYLYSSPIAATVGETFSMSAFATAFYATDAPQTADAALVALWFANETALYPTTSSADIVVDTFTDVPSGPPYVQLSGTVVAPVSGFLRVGLRSTMAVNQSMGWDFVTARRVA